MFCPAMFVQQLDKQEQQQIAAGRIRTDISAVGLVNDIIHFQQKTAKFIHNNIPLPGMFRTFNIPFDTVQTFFQQDAFFLIQFLYRAAMPGSNIGSGHTATVQHNLRKQISLDNQVVSPEIRRNTEILYRMHIHNIQQQVIRQMIGKIIYRNINLSLPDQKNRKCIQPDGSPFLESRILMVAATKFDNNQFILIGLGIHTKRKQVLNS